MILTHPCKQVSTTFQIQPTCLYTQPLYQFFSKVNKNNLPWGNIPVVFFGDFGQLQPWQHDDEPFWNSQIADNSRIFNLTISIRQSNDYPCCQFLENMRLYNFTDDVIQILASRITRKSQVPLNCVHLYSKLSLAQATNNRKLKKVRGEKITYNSIDHLSGMGHIATNAFDRTYLQNIFSQIKCKGTASPPYYFPYRLK